MEKFSLYAATKQNDKSVPNNFKLLFLIHLMHTVNEDYINNEISFRTMFLINNSILNVIMQDDENGL